MATITISKEFASGGRQLAQRLAEELGYRLVGREVLAELAKKLDMSEGEAELLHRGQENALFKLVDEIFLHTVRRIAQKPEAALDDDRYVAAVTDLVKGVAAQGDAVIVGWGGQYILADDPGAHHFRVVAPLAQRAERCGRRANLPTEQGEAECHRQDGISSGYVKHFFKKSWDEATTYKLVLNNGALEFNVEKALSVIKAAL
ncbi:MAG: cytidylate kinase-like family protein [Desulfarculaceae bacterium]|nr:cytidylate kinase-like family protein [Desulfarculaceae bacterium]MCF8047527.1 cytidylate kinase-like family protein [Desulfarculaceae bacterium]MCF8096590.1 cytidylate kinase-like family protein [Desulfarculaceae bacterium]MCF8122248.1 cytidylate kinase-like family protein [Desulfarculaceae bacterium]